MSARPMPLADAVLPHPGTLGPLARVAREAALVLGFAALVAVCAQVAVRLPFTTVPVTGQTFAVLVAGGALGAWRGAAALTTYLVLGILGVPVYAPTSLELGSWGVHLVLPWSGTAGAPWDLSSGGYIVGFIPAAWLVGALAERGWDRTPRVVLAMVGGNALVYVPGLLWLAYLIGSGWVHPGAGRPLADLIPGAGTLQKALVGGLYPFVVGDLLKVGLASLALPGAWALVRRAGR